MAHETASTFELQYPLANADGLAAHIASTWDRWDSLRAQWLNNSEEVTRYLFATDTSHTTNAKLPWKNKTTLPKLTQIRDNLHANYRQAVFPNDNWLDWEGYDENAVSVEKKVKVEAYIKTKLILSRYVETVDKLLLDYIDTGNCFSITDYVNDIMTTKEQEEVVRYSGPMARRISPYDIVFNPAAETFEKSPKIIRTVVTMGDLLAMTERQTDLKLDIEGLKKMRSARTELMGAMTRGDRIKDAICSIAGFSSLQHYYESGYVELLTFYGDIYDPFRDRLLKNHTITVADRAYILHEGEHPDWAGIAPIRKAGWRRRPDTLWAMGPLENLVGMQYRIDHLENLKADAIDVSVYPVMKIKGQVEDFDYGPGERVYIHDDGDVEFMHPDNATLTVDNQIEFLEQRMELYAGAPREALGIRTPGEKTAYEVEQLANASGRLFQLKASEFEMFMEEQVNDFLGSARRNLNVADIAKYVDEETGVAEFMEITKDDIAAKGRLRPIGARHFAERARTVQEMSTFIGSPIGQDPAVKVHISGKKLAKMMEELLGVRKYELVQPNIRILEDYESKRLAQVANEQGQVESQMPVENMPPDGQMAIGPGTPPGVGSDLVEDQ